MPETDAYEMLKRMVLTALSNKEAPSVQDISSAIAQLLPSVSKFTHGDIEVSRLAREIESLCDVWVPGTSTLHDPTGHVEWLASEKHSVQWNFWARYRRFLEDVQHLPPASIRHLDSVSEEVLGLIESPSREGSWDRRGMVVGQVQSGKTANYIGLICKAADAGYRFIVVLAGVYNSLRSQTQLRLDEGFLGFDTQKRMLFDQSNVRIGVGRMMGAGFFHAHSLTSSAESGDFNLAIARNAGLMIGGAEPVLLVVKKYKSVLENLINFATALGQIDPITGRRVVRGVPFLLIDDEADHASINTAPDFVGTSEEARAEVEPTTINRLIRRTLFSFEKSAYVGYTATPFANIFIDHDTATKTCGEDLFPRSFIISLRAPSNYVGPAKVFGLPFDSAAGTEEVEPMPVVSYLSDCAAWVPDRHKASLVVGQLPESLKDALKSFVLTCAARSARGQTRVHNSMLVHVTRFTAVQDQVFDQVTEEVERLRNRLLYGNGSGASIWSDLESLWAEEFSAKSERMKLSDCERVSWSAVKTNVVSAVSRIEIKKINGKAEDILDYYASPDGLSIIAIGGDKLSRGLTLEGLSVSYYLRASRMYDTLMQMGRWFGYRPGYGDLCRLFTTRELAQWYRGIAIADEELRREFEYMRLLGKTPTEYGLRVRCHPDALMVTSRAKMRHARDMDLSFSGTISETVVFSMDDADLGINRKAAEGLLSAAETTGSAHLRAATGSPYVWGDVPAEAVLEFLARYQPHQNSFKAVPKYLAEYITSRLPQGELVSWTVVLLSSRATDAAPGTLGGLPCGLIQREWPGDTLDGDKAIKRLVSPADEILDLTSEEYESALRMTQQRFAAGERRGDRNQAPAQPDGVAVRQARDKSRGLVLLYPLRMWGRERETRPVVGFAISFPRSASAKTISYRVNNIYWEQEVASA